MSSRLWTYSRDEWQPEHRWLLYWGGDEYGRKTIVLPIPFAGYLVWAYRTCHCRWCVVARLQTWRWDRGYFDESWPEWLMEWMEEEG